MALSQTGKLGLWPPGFSLHFVRSQAMRLMGRELELTGNNDYFMIIKIKMGICLKPACCSY